MADVPALFARLSAELASLQAMTTEVEQALGDLIVPQAAPGSGGLRTFQHLDLMNQTLQALSGFCAELAARSSPGWAIDAAGLTRQLPLAALARRLAGEGAAPPGADQGVELFTLD